MAMASGEGAAANLSRKKTTPPQPAKKLVIKPLKAKPKLPENFEEETWKKLEAAVAAVHAKRPVSSSFEELYRAVEDMCLHNMSARLYARLAAALDAHVASCVAALEGASADSGVFLQALSSAWADHCEQTMTVRSLFLYLDRTFVIQAPAPGVKSVWDLGLQLFARHLASRPAVERRAVDGLLHLVERERAGEAADRSLARALTKMFASLGTYPAAFEAPFLAASRAHYAAEAARLMSESPAPAYLSHCERRLSEEADRCLHYLEPSTRKPLASLVESELVEAHARALLDKGFDGMMDEGRQPDLSRLYLLLARVAKLPELRAAWAGYIRRRGQAVVADDAREKEMVQLLLDLKARLDRALEGAFCSSEALAQALKESFEAFINSRGGKPAELVARFVDAKLRAGNKEASDEELEAALDRALQLFRYLQGKDVFAAFYRQHLAKRLLLNKSASTDAEKSMIAKLKAECGSQYTAKLEGMFKDIDVSGDVMRSFAQSAQAQGALPQGGIEMSVHVLTTGYWPTYPPAEVALPPELTVYQESFKQFYLSKHSGRRLLWQNSLGQCHLKANFPLGRKELQVSLFQAVVLMLFNGSDAIPFEQIKAASRIEDKELRLTLQSLACGKVRVLRKEPKGRDVGDGDVFHFNADFSERLVRIKINAIQLKETPEEQAATQERVFQDRQYQVDAAVVRVMKTRKTLSHQLLIAELLNQLKFPCKPQDLKKRIESLIEREYIERDRSNAQVYNYLA